VAEKEVARKEEARKEEVEMDFLRRRLHTPQVARGW
jgi:hypothetical protein